MEKRFLLSGSPTIRIREHRALQYIYDGVQIEVSEPRRWPIEWISFRCHPCTDWFGVAQFVSGELPEAPIVVCKDCLVVLDGWHRLAAAWRLGRRYVMVQFADFHLAGAQDECHLNKVNWMDTLRPWVDLECLSGSYHRRDFNVPCFAEAVTSLQQAGDDRMPMVRWWEHARAVICLGVVQGRSILDVGTRESIVPTYLANRGAHVVAADLCVSAVVAHPNVAIETADATALPFRDANFDAVLCTACIKHIPEDTLAVSEMLRVLKPHGLLALSFDFGQEYAEYPSEATGRRIYNKVAVYTRLIDPFRNDAILCTPVDFDRSNWNDWPIENQAPSVFKKGVNVQVAFVLMRKR